MSPIIPPRVMDRLLGQPLATLHTQARRLPPQVFEEILDELAVRMIQNASQFKENNTEAIHNLATDLYMQASPFVEKERVHRSASAIACDICDPIVGPPSGEGKVYEKGTVSLPLHPNCLCFKTAVLMARDLFVENVRGWLRGENDFLEGYRPFMQQDTLLMAAFASLANLVRGQLAISIIQTE